jgi:ELWxxDGT repeat protein
VLGLSLPTAAPAGIAERVADLNPATWTERAGGLCVPRFNDEPVQELPDLVFGDFRGAGCEVWSIDPGGTGLTLETDLGESGAVVTRSHGSAGAVTYFSGATTLQQGLWRTDGSSAGTFRLASLEPWHEVTGFRPGAPRSFFTRFDIDLGGELWRTDGTVQGTALVTDLLPGSSSGVRDLEGAIVVADRLYFWADRDGDYDREPWRSDGSETGTLPLANRDFDIDAERWFVALPSTVLFLVREAGRSAELWRTDGTPEGTFQIWADPLVSGVPMGPVVNESRVLFGIRHGAAWTLYVSDGTPAGTEMVTTLSPTNWIVGPVAPLGAGWMIPLDDEVHGLEPWITDGTAAGTRLLADVNPGPESSFGWMSSTLDGGLLVPLRHTSFGYDPWFLPPDGGAPVHLVDLEPPTGDSAEIVLLGERDGAAYFEFDGTLWRTDGTAAGTTSFASIDRTVSPSLPAAFIDGEALFFFEAMAWPARSDGTTEGTRFLSGQPPFAGGSSRFSVLEGGTLIGATDYEVDTLVWSSTGDAIEPLISLANPGGPGGDGSIEYVPPAAGPVALYRDFTPEQGWELWALDGSPGGFELVSDLLPGSASSWPGLFLDVGAEVWLTARDAAGDLELWRSEGTPATTSPIRSLWTPDDELDVNVVPVDVGAGELYALSRRWNQVMLYHSPSASSPMTLVREGLSDEGLQLLGLLGDRLFFAAAEIRDPGIGSELWVTDGTAAGTRLLRDFWSGPDGSRIGDGAVLGGRLYFSACEPVGGCEIWSSDGTTLGTNLFLDLEAGPGSSNPTGFTRIRDQLYFAASRVEAGREAWVTDGTRAGTFQLPEIAVGPWSSVAVRERLAPFFLWQDRIYFAGDDGTGSELWSMPPVIFFDGFETGTTSRWTLSLPATDRSGTDAGPPGWAVAGARSHRGSFR